MIDFDNRVTILQKFTTNQKLLDGAIRRTVANGSTSLHNAIYISLKELKKVRATDTEDVRRQAIVVLSDGEDTSSLVPFEEVLELAEAIGSGDLHHRHSAAATPAPRAASTKRNSC